MCERLCDSTAMSDSHGDRRRIELRIYIARMYYRIQHSCAEKRPYFKTGMWTSILGPTGRYLEKHGELRNAHPGPRPYMAA